MPRPSTPPARCCNDCECIGANVGELCGDCADTGKEVCVCGPCFEGCGLENPVEGCCCVDLTDVIGCSPCGCVGDGAAFLGDCCGDGLDAGLDACGGLLSACPCGEMGCAEACPLPTSCDGCNDACSDLVPAIGSCASSCFDACGGIMEPVTQCAESISCDQVVDAIASCCTGAGKILECLGGVLGSVGGALDD